MNKKSDTRLTYTVTLTKVEIVRQGIRGLVAPCVARQVAAPLVHVPSGKVGVPHRQAGQVGSGGMDGHICFILPFFKQFIKKVLI